MGSLLSNRNVVAAAVVLSLVAHFGVSFPYMGLAILLLPRERKTVKPPPQLVKDT